MAADTIQEFLVGLGWKVDGSSQRRFEEALTRSREGALALSAALVGVVATVAKVAQSYDQLYYASQRMYASVANIQGFAYALSQVGGTAAGARASLESIGSFLRSSPGAESFITRLGVQTRDAQGQLRDTSTVLTELGARFRSMPYYRARAYAGVLGIDENTLQALMRGAGQFSEQLKAMYRAAGVDQQQAAAASAKFMQQLRGFGAALQVLRDKVAISLEAGVGGSIERLRALLIHNFDRISEAILMASRIVIGVFSGILRLGGRLIQWFDSLSPRMQHFIELLGAIYVAWKLLNAGFLATPIGRVIALGLALLSLYDDYKTWKEGGKSLINWAEWEPGIKAAGDAISTLIDDFARLWSSAKQYILPIAGWFKNELLGGFHELLSDLSDVTLAIDDLLNKRWKSAGQHLQSIGARAIASDTQDVASVNDAVGSPVDTKGGFVNRGLAYVMLRSMGFERPQIAAMIGNWQQESSLNPGARNGHHYGIEQWDDARADAIKKQFGIDVRTAGFADQVRAAALEITKGGESGRAARFFASTNTAAATGFFATDIERSGETPGMAGYDQRIANAARAENSLRLGGISPSAAASKGQQSIALNQTINVNGAKDPAATAREVHRTTDVSTKALARNMTPLAY